MIIKKGAYMLDIKHNCEDCIHKNICKERDNYDHILDRLRDDDTFRLGVNYDFISVNIFCNYFIPIDKNRRV